jgi:hypothetical protein
LFLLLRVNNAPQYLDDFRCTLSFRRCMRSHFLFREKVKSVLDENELLGLMPPEMRFEVIEFINGDSMKSFPLLAGLEAQMRGAYLVKENMYLYRNKISPYIYSYILGAFSVILPKLNPYCFRKVR